MARRSSSERREYWQRLMREHRKSGLTIRTFCESKGIPEPSFYYWRRYLLRAGSNSAEHSQTPRRRRQFTHFVPVKIQPTLPSGMIELVHRSGHVLRLPPAFDVESLAGILALLAREGS